MKTEQLIKSKARVKNFAEVFTPRHIVNDMLGLLDNDNYAPTVTYLDPSCGNGNFLAAILERKIAKVRETESREPIEWRLFDCAASLYGVDIQEDNVQECRARLFKICQDALVEILGTFPIAYESVFKTVFNQNIVVGDTLKGELVVCSLHRKDNLLTVGLHLFNNVVNGNKAKPMLVYTLPLPKIERGGG